MHKRNNHQPRKHKQDNSDSHSKRKTRENTDNKYYCCFFYHCYYYYYYYDATAIPAATTATTLPNQQQNNNNDNNNNNNKPITCMVCLVVEGQRHLHCQYGMLLTPTVCVVSFEAWSKRHHINYRLYPQEFNGVISQSAGSFFG